MALFMELAQDWHFLLGAQWGMQPIDFEVGIVSLQSFQNADSLPCNTLSFHPHDSIKYSNIVA